MFINTNSIYIYNPLTCEINIVADEAPFGDYSAAEVASVEVALFGWPGHGSSPPCLADVRVVRCVEG